MGDAYVVVTMTVTQAVLLLLSPVIAFAFFVLTRWADEQRWIEDWLDRRRARRGLV